MTYLHTIRVTVLVDNIANGNDLIAEHGFSCLIEADGHRILFDTGAKDALSKNSKSLGVDLSELDALVLSHGHYDHTGGLAAIVHRLGLLNVIVHPNILGPHRSRRTGHDRDIGTPRASRAALDLLHCMFQQSAVEVVDGIWTTGEIPRTTPETHSTGLYIDSAGIQPDLVLDDMALVLRHQQGLVVLLGCAHAGVPDTLAWVSQMFPGEPLLGLLGGTHLDGATSEAISAVTQVLQRSPLRFVAPGHCTGDAAKQALLTAFGTCYRHVCVGMQLDINVDGRVITTPAN